jgi:UDP-N-acetylglucosamine--N-acetylmuramyl-(pentapeptide) pyrophosphoryl-undecaprenol N-acetylglucosamine transferase
VPTIHVLLAGGGTAGHVEPALATADALRRLGEELGVDVDITMLGTASGLESRLVPARGYRLETIAKVPLPRRPSKDVLTVPTRLRGAVQAVARVLTDDGIDVVVGFGGYVCVPAYLAARRAGLPIVVHEANVKPGVANRLGARFAAAVATGLPGTSLRGARLVGMPLRRSISSLDRRALRSQARAHFGVDDRPLLLAFGGSQGAARLNDAVIGAQHVIAGAHAQVLLAAGSGQADDVRRRADQRVTTVVEYIDRMDLAYAAADLVLARSGAMTCAEVAAVGIGSVLVPLPIGNGEQRLNAEALVSAGAALVIEDGELTPATVVDRVVPVLTDPARRDAMGAAAARLGRRDADEVLARLVLGTVLPGLPGPPGPSGQPGARGTGTDEGSPS